jgi:DNA mismatch endonuclease (patch repair protein)
MDTISKAQRSSLMSKVRSKGNRTTEARFRLALVRSGLKHWKLNAKNLPGSPDVVFPSKRTAIFLDGCFWHGCSRCYRQPKTSRDYWIKKVKNNIARDRRNFRKLGRMNWRYIRIWEHQIKADLSRCLNNVQRALS